MISTVHHPIITHHPIWPTIPTWPEQLTDSKSGFLFLLIQGRTDEMGKTDGFSRFWDSELLLRTLLSLLTDLGGTRKALYRETTPCRGGHHNYHNYHHYYHHYKQLTFTFITSSTSQLYSCSLQPAIITINHYQNQPKSTITTTSTDHDHYHHHKQFKFTHNTYNNHHSPHAAQSLSPQLKFTTIIKYHHHNYKHYDHNPLTSTLTTSNSHHHHHTQYRSPLRVHNTFTTQ